MSAERAAAYKVKRIAFMRPSVSSPLPPKGRDASGDHDIDDVPYDDDFFDGPALQKGLELVQRQRGL